MAHRSPIAAALAVGAIVFSAAHAQAPAPAAKAAPLIVEVAEPALSEQAAAGKTLFDANCASCHGASGSGSGKGPPLIHRIYHPGHHGDMSFYLAVRQGSRAHHWGFGDMAPLPQVKPGDIPAIIRYIREVQRENGIR